MNKEFIPYEQALELKELGFDEKCFGYYGIMNELVMEISYNSEPNMVRRNFISAPLYQQAFRWFRENHELSSWIYNSDTSKYFYTILHSGRIIKANELVIIYEEAELACLKKLIEIVK